MLVDGHLALRAPPISILRDVNHSPVWGRGPDVSRAEVDTARGLLAASTLARALEGKTLEWTVVDNYGMGVAALWHAS